MHLPTKTTVTLLMALLPGANSYMIGFFNGKDCDQDTRAGVMCTDIDQLTCCAGRPGKLYVSVGEDASWGYSKKDDEPCGVVLGSGDSCYSVDNDIEVITGGSVVGIVGGTSKRSMPPKVATVDSFFYRNGTERYTLPIDSDDGRLYESFEDVDGQRDFIISHGKFTRLEE